MNPGWIRDQLTDRALAPLRRQLADLVPEGARVNEWIRRLFLHLDEWMAGHRHRYLAYRDAGGMPALIERAGLRLESQVPTQISAVHIWSCKGAAEDDLNR